MNHRRQSSLRTSQGNPVYIFSNRDAKMQSIFFFFCYQFNVVLKVLKAKIRISISHIHPYNVNVVRHLEETHTITGRTCTVHTERLFPRPESNLSYRW